MSDALRRAKEQQHKTACETHVWIRLELLQALIAEIERLELVISSGGKVQSIQRQVRQAKEAGDANAI